MTKFCSYIHAHLWHKMGPGQKHTEFGPAEVKLGEERVLNIVLFSLVKMAY